jgi:NAD(P)-dependent dehydrogenase (short-subunit alcohol dehydrogenase family)
VDKFKDGVAIVTGGASGIGRALCEALAKRGSLVAVADVNLEGAKQVVGSILKAGGEAHAAGVDVTIPGEVQALVESVAHRHGRLDYMFNNAGIAFAGEFRDTTLEHWQAALDIDFWSVVYGATSAYRIMVRQGSGHIVNTSSIGGLIPVPIGTPYAAAKHAVVGFSTSLRTEAAWLGVKVSVVCPGQVETSISDRAVYATKFSSEEALAKIMARGGMISAPESAEVILRGVARNRAIITVTPTARLVWWAYRLFPSAVIALFENMARQLGDLRVDS